MKRDSIIQLIALVVMVATLAGAGRMVSTIDAAASAAQLKFTDQASKGAPLAVTIAQSVGVVRGLMVNYLWIRAEKLKEEGKYFEAYSTAKWITDLQPRFAKVWAFQGWNMAYNISVATHTKEERWKWVQDGIRLIRERGLRYNPNNMMLYKEMAWYFMHKVGGFTDDAHTYYKAKLADRWQGILGEPPYDAEERLQVFRDIVDAPRYQGDLEDQYAQATALIADIKRAGFELDEELLSTIEWIRALETSSPHIRARLKSIIDQTDDFADLSDEARKVIEPVVNLKPLLQNADYTEVWPVLVSFVRGKVMLEEYNMEPSYMLQYMIDYGPMDWRCAASHSLYWSALGVERGLARKGQVDFDRLNTDRQIFHSEQQLKYNGRIVYDFLTKEVSWGPDLRFIPYYEETFLIVLDREKADAFGRGPEDNYIAGYRNFLIDTVRDYYMWGMYDEAEGQYSKLRTMKRRDNPDILMFWEPDKPERFLLPIKDFIITESIDRHTSPQVARTNIQGLLVTGFRFGLARNDVGMFQSQVSLAKALYDYFQKEIMVGVTIVEGDRLGFGKWEEMVQTSFMLAMTTDQNTTLEERMTLWNSSSPMVEQLRLTTYDAIVGSLQASFNRRPLPITFEEAFPAPVGLEAYRIRRNLELAKTEKDDINMERK